MPEMMVDVIKNAIAAADNHLKIAQEKLVEAHDRLEMLRAGDSPAPIRPIPPPNPQPFDLTVICIGLAIFMSLIALVQFLRRRNFNATSGSPISKCVEKMENCLRSGYTNLKSCLTLITHGDRIRARLLQWKTIALCSMFLVVSVSAVYLIMVTPVFGLTGVWTGLLLCMSFIATAGLLRLQAINGSCKFNEVIEHPPTMDLIITESPRTTDSSIHGEPSELIITDTKIEDIPSAGDTTSELIIPNVINKENMTKEIKGSIQVFRSLKKHLESAKLKKINKNDVENIKAAIKTVRSIEEDLKLLKSEENSGDDEKKIQDVIKLAIDAVESLEKIINNGV